MTFDLNYLENNKDFWHCIKYIPQVIPFAQKKSNKINETIISFKTLSKPKPALLNLINQLDNYSNEQNNENNENIPDCKYRNTEKPV